MTEVLVAVCLLVALLGTAVVALAVEAIVRRELSRSRRRRCATEGELRRALAEAEAAALIDP